MMIYLSAGYSHHQLQLPRRPRFRPSLVKKKFEIQNYRRFRTHVYNATKLERSYFDTGVFANTPRLAIRIFIERLAIRRDSANLAPRDSRDSRFDQPCHPPETAAHPALLPFQASPPPALSELAAEGVGSTRGGPPPPARGRAPAAIQGVLLLAAEEEGAEGEAVCDAVCGWAQRRRRIKRHD